MEEITSIHDFSELAQFELSVGFGAFVAISSIIFFTFLQIYSINKPKRFAQVQIVKWWYENQVITILSLVLCIILFVVSASGGAITGERCVLLWPTVQYLLKLLLGFINGTSK